MKKPSTPKQVILDEWITPNDAAEIIGVTPHQVRHLARLGVLESQRFGHAWMVKRPSVVAYAAQERHPGRRPRESSSSD